MSTVISMKGKPEPRDPARIFDPVRDLVPPDLLDFLEQVASLLPDDLRIRLRMVVATAGGDGDPLQRVLEVVRAQWAGLHAVEQLRVALVGPARVGKSSLIAAIGEGNVDRISGMFSVVDYQGLDEYLGYGRSARADLELDQADVVLLVLDGAGGFTEETVRLVQGVRDRSRNVLLVLNRMDLVERPRHVVQEARREFGLPVVGTSLRRPETTRRLLRAMVSACPRALYPLAQQLPSFRRGICRGIVSQAAFGAGLVNGIPIPIGDLLPVSAIQVAMVLKVARAHGFQLNRDRALELIPVLAAGFLVREGNIKLGERFPGKRKLISVLAAASWTALVGSAAVRYFEHMARVCESAEEEPESWSQ